MTFIPSPKNYSTHNVYNISEETVEVYDMLNLKVTHVTHINAHFTNTELVWTQKLKIVLSEKQKSQS